MDHRPIKRGQSRGLFSPAFLKGRNPFLFFRRGRGREKEGKKKVAYRRGRRRRVRQAMCGERIATRGGFR